MNDETIAAIATAPGRGGVAVIRVSGPDAVAVAERIAGPVPAPGTFRFARFRHPATGEQLDEGLVLAFTAPHSYTGEDVVELQGHGGAVVPRRVLEACLCAGARLAHRGEFTARAFLNGRLDYDQAESVLDLVDAKTDRAAEVALEGLHGRRRRALRSLYERLLEVSSRIEFALDVDESDLPADFIPSLDLALADVRMKFAEELRRLAERRILRAGARVVLAGAPNAGKSSLLNALLGESRAIVSAEAGTTRDAIEGWLDLEGWPIRLIDTAGLRSDESVGAIEREGIRRAESAIAEADLVLELVSADDPAAAEAREDSPRIIRLLSKADLAPGVPEDRARLAVSTRTGEGLDALRREIVVRLRALAGAAGATDSDETADRELAAVQSAQRLLPASAGDLVLAGTALARAAAVLGEPLGATYSEDLLDALFSRFCVGK